MTIYYKKRGPRFAREPGSFLPLGCRSAAPVGLSRPPVFAFPIAMDTLVRRVLQTVPA